MGEFIKIVDRRVQTSAEADYCQGRSLNPLSEASQASGGKGETKAEIMSAARPADVSHHTPVPRRGRKWPSLTLSSLLFTCRNGFDAAFCLFGVVRFKKMHHRCRVSGRRHHPPSDQRVRRGDNYMLILWQNPRPPACHYITTSILETQIVSNSNPNGQIYRGRNRLSLSRWWNQQSHSNCSFIIFFATKPIPLNFSTQGFTLFKCKIGVIVLINYNNWNIVGFISSYTVLTV